MGRFRGDRYFSGGPWYIATFAAAEFRYRLAEAVARGGGPAVTEATLDLAGRPRDGAERGALVRALVAQGDGVMAMARRHIPASGELSEQFDPVTGAQISARDLSWSYAAFLTAWDARRRALRAA